MKLVACPDCHAQYDVTSRVAGSEFGCHCGTMLTASPSAGIDAVARRCSACGAVAREEDEACDYCASPIVPAEDRGGLICPECMARNLDDARFCLACGIGFEPRAITSDVLELRCPCCERWMAAREVGGLVVQECPKCQGLWAPDETFDALVARAVAVARERAGNAGAKAPRVDGDNPAASRVEYRRCPCCDALMGRRNFRKRSGVIIDQCHQHGTWLDANELERIAGFVLSGRADAVERMDAANRDGEALQQARRAARRFELGRFETSSSDYSVFGERCDRSSFGSILDLLTAIID